MSGDRTTCATMINIIQHSLQVHSFYVLLFRTIDVYELSRVIHVVKIKWSHQLFMDKLVVYIVF